MSRASIGVALVLGLLAAVIAHPATAQTVDEGFAAYEAGEYERAYDIFLPLAREGDATAQYAIGVFHHYGVLAPAAPAQAAQWYEAAVAAGQLDAMVELGVLYSQGSGVDQDLERALALFTVAAENDIALSQYNLAYLLINGLGTAPDPVGGARWMQRSAAQGYDRAQYELGNLYLNGTGVEKDAGVAMTWFERAAHAGVPEAAYNLGYVYLNGIGIEADPAAAAPWLTQAAEHGRVDAAALLGVMYHDGTGVEQDFDAAARWCDLSARAGNPAGQSCMAILYAQGHGVPKDFVLSYMWGSLALPQLPEGKARRTAKLGLKMLEKWGMSDAEIERALAMARDFRPN